MSEVAGLGTGERLSRESKKNMQGKMDQGTRSSSTHGKMKFQEGVLCTEKALARDLEQEK
jgi:hypothetical protein